MSPDRRALLESMWAGCWITCKCGRCGCAAIDPLWQARRTFDHWSTQFSKMAGLDEKRANTYRRGGELTAVSSWGAKLISEAEVFDRSARRYRHGAVLYGRLSRGEAPFAAARNP